MDPHPATRLIVAGFAAATLLLAGCGGDDDSASDTSTEAATGSGASDAGASGSGSGDGGSADGGDVSGIGSDGSGIAEAIGGDEMVDALDSVGLEGKGNAILTATGAERFEVDGDVLHVYLGNDSRVPEGGECMVVGAVLSEGERAVIHRADGTEVAC